MLETFQTFLRRATAHVSLGFSATFVIGAALTTSACATADHGDTTQPAPTKLAAGFVAHFEPSAAVRFPMPVAGMDARVTDFDPMLAPEKFRHEILLVSGDTIQVLIHVWDNPRHLDSQTWFSENLSGFVDDDTSTGERPATTAHVGAIVIEQPASDQAVSQAVAVFATKDHAYAITCMDPVNDAAAKKLFDRVVDDFEPEVDVSKPVAPPRQIEQVTK